VLRVDENIKSRHGITRRDGTYPRDLGVHAQDKDVAFGDGNVAFAVTYVAFKGTLRTGSVSLNLISLGTLLRCSAV
jgi:hypothetical protein